MGHIARKTLFVLASLSLASALGACGQIAAHRGAIIDPVLSTTLAPGVDNRESVQRLLGRPTFVGQFAPNEWYYVSRNTGQLAFATPEVKEQVILRVTFDGAGNVATVDRAGIEQVADISPEGDKTPTNGRESSFFEELFGNIGAIGVPGAGGAPPN